MSPDSLLYAGIVFSALLAFFLLGCLIAAVLTEPAHDPFSDAADWDGPFIAADDLKLFHERLNITGRQ